MLDRGINNRRLAELTGISSGFLSDFLGSDSKEGKGGIGIEKLNEIAHVLRVHTFELLVDEPSIVEETIRRAMAQPGEEVRLTKKLRVERGDAR